MFKITQENRQYHTYIISNENCSIEIVPERGGIITSWKVENQELLYLDKTRFSDPNLSVRGGIPILFPICGNLPDNTYTFNNQKYELKQHGFARDLPWKVTSETVNNDSASITLTLKSNQETLLVYPFEFEVNFTYQISKNSLKIEQNYTNKSGTRMPFSTGLHPYFAINNKSQLQVKIPANEYQDQKTKTVHPWEGNFDFSQAEIDAAFMPINANTTSLIDQANNREIKISFSDLYSLIVFWTLIDKDYVCLEPWTGPRNSLNTGVGLIYVNPETTVNTRVEMSIKKI
jgi:galactose mutarotase-like enzyme